VIGNESDVDGRGAALEFYEYEPKTCCCTEHHLLFRWSCSVLDVSDVYSFQSGIAFDDLFNSPPKFDCK